MIRRIAGCALVMTAAFTLSAQGMPDQLFDEFESAPAPAAAPAAPAPVAPAPVAEAPAPAPAPAPVAETPAPAPAPAPAPVAETPAPAPAPVAETPAPAPAPAPVAETPAPAPAPVAETPAPAPSPVVEAPAPVAADEPEVAAADDGKAAKPDKQEKASSGPTPMFSRPAFELSIGATTVGGEQWTRIALGMDVPIWKFGVFFDIELYIDSDNNFSNKGWEFSRKTWAEDLFRKIRYIRYGYEDDPLFAKFGGLDNVTFGHGMIIDRFTNMLHYPSEKLLGLQFYLNDISPLGITLQTLISDFADVKDQGGLMAARLAFKPLKTLDIPILSNLQIGGTYAADLNVNAPSRKWKYTDEERMLDSMRRLAGGYSTSDKDDPNRYGDPNHWFNNPYKDIYYNFTGNRVDDILDKYDAERNLGISMFDLYGFDFNLPILRTGLLALDIYGHSGFRTDDIKGWGVGVPGFALKVWKFTGNVEYRHIENRFTPGFFDTYYLDERLTRTGLLSKDDRLEELDGTTLDGVFGRGTMDVWGFFKLGLAYQWMTGEKVLKDTDGNKVGTDDKVVEYYEGSLGLGETIVSRIPKIERAEIYIRNSDIGTYPFFRKKGDSYEMDMTGKKAGLFDPTPGMYWGYRLGFEIASGASLICDYRYGYKVEGTALKPNNQMLIQTAFKF